MLSEMKINYIPRLELCKDLPFCVEDCLTTVCHYFDVDGRVMFSKPIPFLFFKSNCLSLINLQFNFLDRIQHYSTLLQHVGVKIQVYEKSWKEMFSIMIRELNEEKPVLVLYDSFWCPWDPIYKKENRGHAFLVTGFERKTGKFKCMDPYFKKETIDLSLIDMMKGCTNIATFQLNKSEKLAEKRFSDSIGQIMQDNDSIYKQNIKSLHEFVECIHQVDTIKDSDKMFWNFPIFFTINSIIEEKYKSILFIESLPKVERSPRVEEFKNNLTEIMHKWLIVRGLLIKVMCMEKTAKKYLVTFQKQVQDNIIFEEKMLTHTCFNHDMCEEFIIEPCCLEETSYFKQHKEQRYYVNLKPFLNNKAFDKQISVSEHTDISGYGDYFLLEDKMPDNPWKKDQFHFYTYINDDKENDNISCNGQYISVKEDYYKRIQIMACSEYGGYADYLSLISEEERCSKIPIYVNDWAEQENKVPYIWCGKVSNRLKEKNFIHPNQHKIYSLDYILPSSLKINKIQLPYIPNIHIFAITLFEDALLQNGSAPW